MTLNTDDLRTMLREQTLATPVNPARHAEIDRRVRRMRRRRAAIPAVTGAAGVVAVVLAGALIGAPGGPGGGPAAGGRPRPAKLSPAEAVPLDLPKAEPAEKLWPQAVHRVPAKLPNGRKLRPEGFVDDHRLIVTTNAGFERVGAVWEYDLDSGKARELVKVPIPAELQEADDNGRRINLPDDFTVGSGQVVWWLGYQDGRKHVVEIWSAPIGGGQARRVTTITPSKDRGGVNALLAVTGGKVVWSGTGGEVFEAPLAGGPARRIGPAGYQLVAWPWIGGPAGPDRPEGNVLEPADRSDHTYYGELRNVVTGERRSAAPVAGHWTCGLVWCLGATKDAPGGVVRRRDEKKGRSFPGSGSVNLEMLPEVAALDRFVLRYARDGGIELYDLRTGKLGRLGKAEPGGGTGLGGFWAGERIYGEQLGEEYTVVDLTAIR